MSSILTIAGAESRRLFVSPLAWVVLAVLQLILGFVFIQLIYGYIENAQMGDQYSGIADYMNSGLFGFSTVLLLLVMPLMSMRIFAEERKSGSITLLLSSPVSLIDIVLGKFLGLMSFMLLALLLLALMPLSLRFGTPLDLGKTAAGLLGLLLMMMAFGAAGLFVSTLTKEPTIAAVTSFGLLLLVWLFDVLGNQSNALAPLFAYLSLVGHFQKLSRGIFDSTDVLYYLLFTASFLWLAVQRLDFERA